MSNGPGIIVALAGRVFSGAPATAVSHLYFGTAWLARVLVAVLIVSGLPAAGAGQVERELEEAKLLARESRYAEAAGKLERVIDRLEGLAALDARRARLADACLELAFSYLSQDESPSARRVLKALVALDADRHLSPGIYGPTAIALLDAARAEMGLARSASQEAALGSLSVASDIWVFVSIDGGAAQQTPLTAQLPAGRHRLVATRPGFADREMEVEIREGESQRIHIALQSRKE